MARVSRQEFEDSMDRRLDILLEELENKLANIWLFTPDRETSGGTVGDQMKIARLAYKEQIKCAIRKSIWLRENDHE